MTRRGFCFRVFGVAAVLAVAGCSRGAGTVSGTVTIGGQPVANGQISFVTQAGMPYTFNIAADGTYQADGLPPGEMTVLVFVPRPPSADRVPVGKSGLAKKLAAARAAKPATAPTPTGPTVPAKYADVTTSDLRYTVTTGPQTYDPKLD